jgi:uncharacterized protein GlcG (DUF336 family)
MKTLRQGMRSAMSAVLVLAGVSLWAFPSVTIAQEDSPVVSVKRLSMVMSAKIAAAAVAACSKRGIQVTATVVDRNGEVQVMMRDTIAAPLSIEVSRRKAYTAANFAVSTAELLDRGQGGLAQVDSLMFSRGGLPIKAAGLMLGAVGVSGAPSGETDEECAQAGIDAVIDDLEMM